MSILDALRNASVADGDGALSRTWLPAVQRIAGLPFVARAPRAAAQELVTAAAAGNRALGEHVHLANAYSIATAVGDPDLAAAFEHGRGWLLPDGRPLMWSSALRGDAPRLRQVRGPQLMRDVVELGREAGLRHYLLGSTPEVLAALQDNLERAFPGARFVGADSPPFHAPSEQELADRDAAIAASGAQIVWVGLGTPKQDFEAARLAASLPVVAVAVGAAFDYSAGTLSPAPHWVSTMGFEWLWRFAAEPRRLWRRYTIGNLVFLRALLGAELQERRRLEAWRGTAHRRAVTVVGQLPPPLHGSAVMTGRLVEAISVTGRDVRVVDRRFSRSVGEVGRIGFRKMLAIPSLALRFVAATRRSSRVVLLVTTTPASFLMDSVLLALTRKPVVLYVHTVGFRSLAEKGGAWARLVLRTLGRAESIVVLGPTLVDDVSPFVPRHRITVVPNCTPEGSIVDRPSGARLLFLSNLLPGKGADVFVRLAAQLQQLRPELDWRFDLAGAGDVAALGPLPAGLVTHGPVAGDAKRALLEAADVLVVPSTYALEAQPLVIIEALSHGIAVVAYDNGGIRDLVDESVGALVPVGSEFDLTAAVVALVGDPDRLCAAREAAVARYRAAHAPAVFADSWRAIVEGAASAAVPASGSTVPPVLL